MFKPFGMGGPPGPAGMDPMFKPGGAAATPGIIPQPEEEASGLSGLLGGLKEGFGKMDKNKAAMMMSVLSNGFGNMTLRGNGGLKQMNNAIFAQANKNITNNKSMEYLKTENPALHAQLMKLPEGVRDQYMGVVFEKMLKDPKDQFKVLTAEEKEARGLPADGSFKVNLATNEVSGVGSGGTTITNNMPGAAPTPKAGFQNVWTEDGKFSHQEVIPGGPVDLEQKADADRGAKRGKQKADAGMTVVQDLQRSLDLINDGNGAIELPSWAGGDTGVGEVVEGLATTGMAKLPRTDANAALGFANSAKANIGLDQLQLMRETSPTGGALGQVPVQQQIKLESLLGSLDPTTMRPEDYRNNASRAINIYLDLVVGNRQERAGLIEQGILTPEDNEKIEEMYKQLPFGKSGKPFDLKQPPPDFFGEGLTIEDWEQADEQTRLRAWNEHERATVPQFYLYD